jgi:TatA/E family protein of Tat protein translocase
MPWGLTPAHLIIILIIVLVVVGPGRLPETGAAIGKALRGFKDALEGQDTSPSNASGPSQPTPNVLSQGQAPQQYPPQQYAQPPYPQAPQQYPQAPQQYPQAPQQYPQAPQQYPQAPYPAQVPGQGAMPPAETPPPGTTPPGQPPSQG